MPPFRFKAPQEVRIKVPIGRIPPAVGPEIRLGKSIVAVAPHRVTAEQLEDARRVLRRVLGRSKEVHQNVHATYAVTRKPEGTKMGQGKGSIDRFVARVPAGRILFHIPQINPFHPFPEVEPNFAAFKAIAPRLPVPVAFREQNNFFQMHSVKDLIRKRQAEERENREKTARDKLGGFHTDKAEHTKK
ncbi:putative 50S ribosomal protein L16 [Toxoplasma gondii TgCatPRC2]|uniref:Putative 50S ribosomal protein L16 n=2 Tax=Toxoplasma gondii TaxID=5811 RepID=A0A151H1T8_TOXGO|nr:putative 50S ribosomal protein L16 [Toxoplasma gondii p89]KYK63252.1 putative 50S ribosomal protein L16 [Toxoplasma gondii TgCatPRC2]